MHTRYIKHPSWRVYKAALDCNISPTVLKLRDFSKVNATREGHTIDIYIPYKDNDDLTNELCKVLKDESYKETKYGISDCLDLFVDVKNKQLLEVMLLNDRPLSEICKMVNCSNSFALTYKSLFYDTTVFKTNAEKRVYLAEGCCPEDAIYKKEYLEKGEEYVKLKNANPENVDLNRILYDALAASYKAMFNNINEADTNSQEIAQGWADKILKLVVELKKNTTTDDDTLSRLIINLTTENAPTKSIDDLS